MDSSEKISPQISLKSQYDRQESLQHQLNQLDSTKPGDCVLGKFLSMLYRPENYQKLDELHSSVKYLRYQPKSALHGHITHGSLGDFVGIYEYQPITQALENIEDYFAIFPQINKIFQQFGNKSPSKIIRKITETITQETDIPIVFTQSSHSGENDWTFLQDGNVVNSRLEENNIGQHNYVYHGTPEAYAKLKARGYPDPDDLKLAGDAIVLNHKFLNHPDIISTCPHELGHIAENRFVMPQKELELPGRAILDTEVLSSLYGLKASLLMADSNADISFQMIQAPVRLYNWILTGTVAP